MGDRALLVELGSAIDERLNERVHALARGLFPARGVTEIIPAYASLLVEFDPTRISHSELTEQLTRAASSLTAAPPSDRRVVEIPTRYGGEFGPDLEFVAAHNRISPEDVIRIHTSSTLRVFMLGFAPGFPYLGQLPPEIAAPRLEAPRVKVPAGSVGIAGLQTGIYPRQSPGGWRLIGRTDVQLFNPQQDPPTLLQAGDYVRFTRVE